MKNVSIASKCSTGVIAGLSQSTMYENCTVEEATINVTNSDENPNSSGVYYSGGIVGRCEYDSSFIDCKVTSLTIDNSSSGNCGGIIGQATLGTKRTFENCSANNISILGVTGIGGIVGYENNTMDILNCDVTGNISGNNGIGGIIGMIQNMNNNSKIMACTFDGVVLGEGINVGGIGGQIAYFAEISDCISSGSASGSYNVGGITGDATWNKSYRNCSSSCDVTSSAGLAGGLIGNAYGIQEVSDCHSTGNVTITGGENAGGFFGKVTSANQNYTTVIIDCSSSGEVMCNSNKAGGFAGSVYKCELTNCESKGDTYGENYIGGFAAETDYSKLTDCSSYGSAIYKKNTDLVNYSYNWSKFSARVSSSSINNCHGYGSVQGIENYETIISEDTQVTNSDI